MNRPPRRAVAVVVLGLLAGVAGCGGSPTPAPSRAAGPVPAVVDTQVDRILAGVGATSPDALDSRLDGAELEVRRAAVAVREQVPTSPELAPLSGEELLAAVPAAGAWPRWFLTAVRPSADAVPQLLVLVQAGPREAYKVTAAATLLPGQTLPDLARSRGLVQVVDPAATGLLTTPTDAVAGYADVLTAGDSSPAAATTVPDAFRDQVLAEQASERDGVSEYVEYSAKHTPRSGALWSLRAKDGGALVVAVLDGARSFTPRGVGVSQSLPPDLAALAGRDTAARGLDVQTAEVVVLHVPPADTDDAAGTSARQVSLVAGQRGTTAVQVR